MKLIIINFYPNFQVIIMTIERTDKEIIIRIPSFINIERIQNIIDLLAYLEATAKSQATQADVDALVDEIKKGWWKKISLDLSNK